MTQKEIILLELKELESSLVNISNENIYQVPVNYFEGLSEQVMRRIKAMDADNAADELNSLSPFLSSVSKNIPYSVPAGYFDDLAKQAENPSAMNDEDPVDELERLSPLLSGLGGLKKEMPFTVPAGYFENLNTAIKNETKPAAKVVSITKQKWFRYAAAAVVIGFIAVTGLVLLNKDNSINPATQSSEWVKKNTKKISTDEINNFVELAEEEAPVIASADPKNDLDKNEIKDLIKVLSDKDIEDFLDETQADNSTNDDALMN